MAVVTHRFRLRHAGFKQPLALAICDHGLGAASPLTYDCPALNAPFAQGLAWLGKETLSLTPKSSAVGGCGLVIQFRLPVGFAGLASLGEGLSGALVEILPQREIPEAALPAGAPAMGWHWDILHVASLASRSGHGPAPRRYAQVAVQR